MGLAIRNVLAKRTKGAREERRVTAPTTRNGDRMSGGLCACCKDGCPVSGHALADCLAPPFSFFLALLRVGRGNERGRLG